MHKKSASDPVLHDYQGDLSKAWYVGFTMPNPNNPGERRRFQIRGFINSEHKIAGRRTAGHGLTSFVRDALSSGWNPFELTFVDWIKTGAREQAKSGGMGLIDALKHGLAGKKDFLATKTHGEYSNTIKYAETAAKTVGLTNKPIKNVTRGDCKKLLRQIQKDRGWTAHAYNKAIQFLSACAGELLDDEIIDFNPFYKIKRQEWVEVNCHVPPTDQQQELIKATLMQNCYPFFVYAIAIYHTGIRPKELLGLRIGDLDPIKKTFRLTPGDERTKTNKDRTVPINPHLWGHIEKMNLWKYPSEWHIFSKDFLPGANRLHRNTATYLWKKVVKDPKPGLGINCNMYSLKHKGADDKILAGIDLDALRELYGHSSKFMTEKYAKIVKQVYRKQIIDKSPDF